MELVLDLEVPAGGRVRTTWRAAAGTPRAWAWVQHGFARHARDLAGVAHLLAGQGIATVSPDIATVRPWRSLHDTTWLTSVALTIAQAVEGGVVGERGIDVRGPWLGVGHSAGAAVVAHAASVLLARTPEPIADDRASGTVTVVAGLVLLDPVDSAGHVFARALRTLDGVAVEALACRPSRCNRRGALCAQLTELGLPVSVHADLNHADPERIPAVLEAGAVPPASRAGAALCGPAGPSSAVVSLGRDVIGALDRVLAPGEKALAPRGR